MNKVQKVSILGTEYTVLFSKAHDDPILDNCDGYTDKTTKKIVIGEKERDCDLEDFGVYQRQVLRHEIIHAYFMESGLQASLENEPQGVPEMYVDWFAIQSPKIFETFDELGILETLDTASLLDAICNGCFGAAINDCERCDRTDLSGNEYQRLAMRTANPDCRNLSNVGLGITGESGEVADMIKKHLHHGHELDKEHLKKELGDVLWYVALGCTVAGFSMTEVMQLNIDKLKARYPEGFSEERSKHRKAGDV